MSEPTVTRTRLATFAALAAFTAANWVTLVRNPPVGRPLLAIGCAAAGAAAPTPSASLAPARRPARAACRLRDRGHDQRPAGPARARSASLCPARRLDLDSEPGSSALAHLGRAAGCGGSAGDPDCGAARRIKALDRLPP